MNQITLKTPEEFQALTAPEVRGYIDELEQAVLATGEKIEVPVEHHFSKDVYAREMKMPKGSLVIGKIHKFQNLNILSEGEALVLSIDGAKHVKAPFTFVGSAGAKRVIFALTDLVWTTVHGTNETDVDKIENNFIAKTYADVPALIEGAKL